MSVRPIDRSDALRLLRDEGYSVFVENNFLVIDDIPYVDSNKTIAYGRLISVYPPASERVPCRDHRAYFSGNPPCDQHGIPLNKVINNTNPTVHTQTLKSDMMFSAKPPSGYKDYHEKMTTYIELISGHARIIDPEATPKLHRIMPDRQETGVFNYPDTNSSRADIDILSNKLAHYRIGIIGLGGTGSYILDHIAKTPVAEIRLIDGDDFSTHNAFRTPGAANVDELNAQMKKVDYHKRHYDNMHQGITAHAQHITMDSLHLVDGLSFVFIAIDQGEVKKALFDYLDASDTPYIDVGMELERSENGPLFGRMRTTLFDDGDREQLRRSVSFGTPDDGLYGSNIQISELNAINAGYAVLLWKLRFGFYHPGEDIKEVTFLPHAFGVSLSGVNMEDDNET